jgi:hypothetical protein
MLSGKWTKHFFLKVQVGENKVMAVESVISLSLSDFLIY